MSSRRNNISRVKRIHRRQLLRGWGAVGLSLPFLECMRDRVSAGETQTGPPPKRSVWICAGLGFHAPFLFPSEPGPLKANTPYLHQLRDHLDQVTLFSGLSHPEQQGNNGHASSLTFLTSAQRPGLAGFKNTISIDQLIAQRIGMQTRFPYLALSTSGRSLSWTSGGVPIPGSTSPSQLFRELFLQGNEQQIASEIARLRRGHSILDTVTQSANTMAKQLGSNDRHKLQEYFQSVRELEHRLTQSEGWVRRPKPKVDAEEPDDIRDKLMAIERQAAMYDMITLALQTDSTRTVTFGISGLNAAPKIPGVASDWHGLSHHGKDPAKIEELKLIEQAEFTAFAKFLDGLRSIQEGDCTLLDQTTVVYGSNLGNASSHDWHNLPILVAGGGYRHGQYVAHDHNQNTPLANLFVGIAQGVGIEIDQFGSSVSAGIRGLEPLANA
ncbi:DUF1552 domain-containing protein [Crateriforma spongiae]|uniref:DUF1552 domain-containing protein n=1 Tax=Crateriforma spongiae TaxID=2724528 RepID=UPI00144555F3|nr:DUF1552 domain-containing protein [Crateriforma spongiae]